LLEWDETARDIEVIWVCDEEEYFFEKGWTPNSSDRPPGKSVTGEPEYFCKWDWTEPKSASAARMSASMCGVSKSRDQPRMLLCSSGLPLLLHRVASKTGLDVTGATRLRFAFSSVG
jgi:hypothetical protein